MANSMTLQEAEAELARRIDALLDGQVEREIETIREAGWPIDDNLEEFTQWRTAVFEAWRTEALAEAGRFLREPDAPSHKLQ